MDKKANLILLGAPGSGKGTRAVAICKVLGISQVATGDLFRKNLSENTDLGKLAKGYMDRGELVPDDVTAAMVKERLSMPDVRAGFVLDGFPRTVNQAKMLDDILSKLGENLASVIYLDVSDDEIVKRLAGRLVCKNCQAPYHTEFTPPKVDGVCDKCGGALLRRDDDNPETIRKRLKVFHESTYPLIEFYEKKGLLVRVKSEISPKGLEADMRDILEKMGLLK